MKFSNRHMSSNSERKRLELKTSTTKNTDMRISVNASVIDSSMVRFGDVPWPGSFKTLKLLLNSTNLKEGFVNAPR